MVECESTAVFVSARGDLVFAVLNPVTGLHWHIPRYSSHFIQVVSEMP
jgi:hypothetical protein